jgi:hypothetical protein
MAIAMARSDARMRLLDASLVAAISHHAEAFGVDFKGWCAANLVSRSTAYRHKKRIEELGRWEPLPTRPKSRPDHTTVHPSSMAARQDATKMNEFITSRLGRAAGNAQWAHKAATSAGKGLVTARFLWLLLLSFLAGKESRPKCPAR